MALSKNQMSVKLAKLEWQLEGIIENVANWTKEDTKRQLHIFLNSIVNLQTEHDSPRKRAPNGKTQNDETTQNESTEQQEELSV